MYITVSYPVYVKCFLHIYLLQDTKGTMAIATGILDLPTELFYSWIFRYLDEADIYNLGEAGSQRLKQISEGSVKLGQYSKTSLL